MCSSKSRLPESSFACFDFNWSRTASLLAIAIAFCVANSGLVVAQGRADDSRVSVSLKKKLNRKVITPLLSGDQDSFQTEFSAIISQVSDEVLEDVEAFGKENGISSLRVAFFKAWQDSVLSGRVPSDFKLKRSVLMYLTSGMVASTLDLTEEIENHELMRTETVSEQWRESRRFFIEAAGLKSRVSELETMGMFIDKSLGPYRNSKNPQQEITATLSRFDAAALSFSKLQKQVFEKEAVLRLQRFDAAAKRLMQPSDFEDDLVAALFLEEDVKAVKSFFANANEITSPELKRPELVQSMRETIENVRNSGNSVIKKAKLLSTGLNQWRRGRYGVGAEANGLLKAQFRRDRRGRRLPSVSGDELQMPENPIAISRFLGEDSGEGYDRRHYYTWDLEYRPLRKRFVSSSEEVRRSKIVTPLSEWESEQLTCSNNSIYTQHSRDVETEATREAERKFRYDNDFAPQDDTIPPRIVGTHEYAAALTNLEKLVESSTPDEIAVYDKIISQLPEYVFYSGMASGVDQPESIDADPNGNGADAKTDQVTGNPFKKHSLAWLMGLARVELSATRSMYLPGDDWFVPTPALTFGLVEYYHVLLDDVAVHLQGLEADAKFKRAIKKSFEDANSDTLASLRRLKMISSMLIALEKSGAPMIADRATGFRKKVTGYTEVLTAQVKRSIQKGTATSGFQSNTTTTVGKETFNTPHP